jgi:hypothetical protein
MRNGRAIMNGEMGRMHKKSAHILNGSVVPVFAYRKCYGP